MSKIQIHPTSQARLDTMLADLPQSLIISGPEGIGLTAITDYIGSKLSTPVQTLLPEKDEKVDIEKGTITVDSVRRLYDMTKTIETDRRIIVIDYAERMAATAQNAFLKLLEEPSLRTHFILLSHDPSRFLPTILSRAQRFELQPIIAEQSNELLDELKVYDVQKRSQLLFMASGLPAKLTRLVTNDAYFATQVQIVRDARQFLQGSVYDRLVIAQSYKDDRFGALTMITNALKLVESNVAQGKSELLPAIDSLLKAYGRIEANGNVRLQLAAAMV